MYGHDTTILSDNLEYLLDALYRTSEYLGLTIKKTNIIIISRDDYPDSKLYRVWRRN